MSARLLVLLLLVAASKAAPAPSIDDGVVDPDVAFPEFFKVCSRNSPDRDNCIRDSIQSIVSNLKSGSKVLAIPAWDPYSSEDFKVNYDQNAFKLKIAAHNIKWHGLGDMNVKAVRSKVTDDAVSLDVDVFYPKLVMEGNYKGKGRANIFELNSEGIFNITMIDVAATWRIKAAAVERNGETYMSVGDFKQSLEIGDMKLKMTGVLPDPELNKFANNFLNENWRLAYAELLPSAEKLWGPVMIGNANSIMAKIPYRRLFPLK